MTRPEAATIIESHVRELITELPEGTKIGIVIELPNDMEVITSGSPGNIELLLNLHDAASVSLNQHLKFGYKPNDDHLYRDSMLM